MLHFCCRCCSFAPLLRQYLGNTSQMRRLDLTDIPGQLTERAGQNQECEANQIIRLLQLLRARNPFYAVLKG